MGPVAQVVSPGAALVVACVLAACAGIAVALGLSRSARRRRATLDTALIRSREEVESLSRKVEALSDEVVRARRAADQDREYLITSLGSGEGGAELAAGFGEAGPGGVPRAPRPVTGIIENQLVEALARQPRTSMVRTRAVDLAVRSMSLAHGVRRALSADVRDRAAAEAHVARRRSRRDRKRQLRQARRAVPGQGPVPGSGQEVA